MLYERDGYEARATHELLSGEVALLPPPGSEIAHDLGPITPGNSITSTISVPDELDTVTVSLVAGQTYLFSLAGSGASPLVDTYLEVFDPGLVNIAIDDDGGHGTNSLLTFTAATTGTYTLRLGSYPDYHLTGEYTVSVEQRGADNAPGTIGGNPVLVAGTELNFLETAGDRDTFQVNLAADTYYSFLASAGVDYASPFPAGASEFNPVLTIYDSLGNVLATTTTANAESVGLNFQSDAAGAYYITIEGAAGQTGGYALSMEAIDLSGEDPLDSIEWGTSVPSTNVSVYFAADGEVFDGEESRGWTGAEQMAALAALQAWADVTNLVFTVTGNAAGATFRLVAGDASIGALGYMNPPGTLNEGVAVFNTVDDNWTDPGALAAGGSGFYTLVHEFGHGLGLAHPHDTGGTSEVMVGVTGPFDSYGVFDLNQGVYTVMSYNPTFALHPDAVGGGVPGNPLDYGYQAGPGAFDIAVLQALYGADATRNSGNNTYTLPTANAAGTYYSTIWDTAGTDTIIHNGAASALIDLTAATLDYSPTGGGVVSFVDGIFGGFTIANGVVIENATGGTGADTLVGNSAANRLDGRGGADTMIGRGGNDTYVVDNAGDVVTEATGEGTDTIESSLSLALGANVERLTLTGAAAINGTGNALANLILGNSANNTLNGMGGADDLRGGLGNDRYVVDNAGDAIVELDGQGADTVDSSVTFSLAGQFLETLRLTGTAAINGTGNSLANLLTGNSNANILDGGVGADEMRGGQGEDVYWVDNAGDKVVENNGDGSDLVYSSVTWSLAGQYIEVLELLGAAAINGTGNGLANRLVGNSAANILYGMDGNDRLDGRGGADTMRGGLGNDVFVVDNAGDIVQENDGEGTDTVEASITYSLVGRFVELLVLTGSANINGTGNGLANTLIGNAGNNTLNGMGGADSLRGGAGDDVLIVDNVGDTIVENNGEGYDTVQSSVTFSLAGQYADALVLTGSANINGTGNGLANVLTGNSGNNLLNGGAGDDVLHGGLGSDTLAGAAGLDHYWFETALGASNVDTISGFVAADDTIHLDRSIFAGIAANGTLAAGAFRLGTAALDADDRILYDAATGNIWYDADGAGGAAAVLFAKLAAGTALTNADFVGEP